MSRIVTIGSASQDIYMIDCDDFESVPLDRLSIFGKMVVGSKIDIDKVSYEVGGSGTNTAVTFARYGHETIFMGNLGRDAAGEAVLECLDRENIDSSYVEIINDGQTACSVVLLDARSAERTILAYRGVSASFRNLDPDDLDDIHPDWLYVTSLRGDMDMLLAFFEKAQSLGAKVMFNPGDQEIEHLSKLVGLLDLVDVLIVNKEEAARIVPGVILAELVDRLANYCPIVIITDGTMGAIATNRTTKETYRFGVYEQDRLRDRTGAGDALGSGFLAKWADGGSFEDSLIFAAANASKVTQHYGAKSGIITCDEDLHPMPIQAINYEHEE